MKSEERATGTKAGCPLVNLNVYETLLTQQKANGSNNPHFTSTTKTFSDVPTLISLTQKIQGFTNPHICKHTRKYANSQTYIPHTHTHMQIYANIPKGLQTYQPRKIIKKKDQLT